MFGHLCYKAVNEQTHYMDNIECIFSSVELVQVFQNLGNAASRPMYNELHHEYSVETGAAGLNKLFHITKRCKACHLFTKQPNRQRVVLIELCAFNFDVIINITFIK